MTVIKSEVLVNRAPLSANTFGDIFFCNQMKSQTGDTLLGEGLEACMHVQPMLGQLWVFSGECFKGTALFLTGSAEINEKVFRQSQPLLSAFPV